MTAGLTLTPLTLNPMVVAQLLIAIAALNAANVGMAANTRDAIHKSCHLDASSLRIECSRSSRETTVAAPWRAPQVDGVQVLAGTVIKVADGDSFTAKVHGRTLQLRLADIDAPEHDQPYAREARATLRALLGTGNLTILPRDVDRYGRIVAYVWAGEVCVNQLLVLQGAAWFYPAYAQDESLFAVESAARDSRRGLWQLPSDRRIEPWQWRKNSLDAKPAAR